MKTQLPENELNEIYKIMINYHDDALDASPFVDMLTFKYSTAPRRGKESRVNQMTRNIMTKQSHNIHSFLHALNKPPKKWNRCYIKMGNGFHKPTMINSSQYEKEAGAFAELLNLIGAEDTKPRINECFMKTHRGMNYTKAFKIAQKDIEKDFFSSRRCPLIIRAMVNAELIFRTENEVYDTPDGVKSKGIAYALTPTGKRTLDSITPTIRTIASN